MTSKEQFLEQAEQFFIAGNYAQALESFDMMIQSGNNAPKAYAYKGLINMYWGNYKAAKDSFLKALDLKPVEPFLFLNLSIINRRMGLLEEAFKYLELALESEDNMAELFVELGHCYYSAGQYNDAMNAYTEALKRTESPAYLHYLSTVCAQNGLVVAMEDNIKDAESAKLALYVQ